MRLQKITDPLNSSSSSSETPELLEMCSAHKAQISGPLQVTALALATLPAGKKNAQMQATRVISRTVSALSTLMLYIFLLAHSAGIMFGMKRTIQ